MSAPLNVVGGNFTLTTALISSGVQVECPFGIPDYVELLSLGKASDYTDGWGEASDAQAIQWWWEKTLPQNYAKGILQASEGSTPQLPGMSSYVISSSGIAAYNTANPPTYTGLATSAITGSTAAYVCTMGDTGSIQVGDYVRIYGTTAELQIAGYPFQVTAVSSGASITLGYMATGGVSLAADATSGTVVKYIPNRMYPRVRWIANVTQAANAVVYFTEKHDFTIGEIVSFRVPSSEYDMTELDNVEARVISVTNSSTESSITVDLDTSGFTAFDFPTSAEAAAGVSPAICVPSSSGVVPVSGTTAPAIPVGNALTDAYDNRNVNLVNFGSGLFGVSGHASENLDRWAYRMYKYSGYDTRILN